MDSDQRNQQLEQKVALLQNELYQQSELTKSAIEQLIEVKSILDETKLGHQREMVAAQRKQDARMEELEAVQYSKFRA